MRGSVLMEFIIVLPIYLVLFAGTILTGDMLVHSNRLGAADRMLAFEVDGHGGGIVSKTAGWNSVLSRLFHLTVEIADDKSAQDDLSQKTLLSCYAEDNVTGPWTTCAAVAVVDKYKPLAGGTLGQLLAVPALLGGAGTNNPFANYGNGVDVRSTQSRLGGSEKAVFFTLKRRDRYSQRNVTWSPDDTDTSNWRDRNCISRLLLGGGGTEYWRQHIADAKQWHDENSIKARYTNCDDNLPDKTVATYRRYDEFEELSD